ncbi:hypothetical protein HMPREF1138_2130 [Actinomyces sp. ICM58]|nr:hypothetical protein HMPREF1138_2130 [Actinomyces sp. ICM58]
MGAEGPVGSSRALRMGSIVRPEGGRGGRRRTRGAHTRAR